jgi:hypothetical protein
MKLKSFSIRFKHGKKKLETWTNKKKWLLKS